jgi:hypothetical protein
VFGDVTSLEFFCALEADWSRGPLNLIQISGGTP